MEPQDELFSPAPEASPASQAEAAETADAPQPDGAAPEATAPPADETPLQTLARLAEAAKARRLPPAEEERAAALLREPLAGGKAGIASVLELLAELPWIVSVNALTAAWPEWSVPMRRHLLASLAKLEGEGALRLRLSLARGLFKSEPAAALKLTAAVAADLREAETGAFPPRHRQLFANVLIGKGKPWLLQLPLGELKGAEAEALARAAVEGALLSPPLSQLSILRWLHGAGRLKKLPESDLAALAKAVSRWNGKLQRQLRADIPELPEAIIAVLKPEPAAPAASPGGEPAAETEAPTAETEGTASQTPQPERPRRGEREAREPREPRKPVEERPARPAAASRNEPEKGRKPFDFKETLRALDAYVGTLRSELEQARTQLRRREDEGRRGRGREEKPAVDVEALQRHNRQLEESVAELRRQLEEIASHDEAVAESRRLHSDQPLPEGSAEQLRSLLSIRLQESYETYAAMRLEPLDRVFRLDYRDLLGSVFEALIQEGVALVEPKPPRG